MFRVNCTGTFNVYRAAADEGIMRVVCASSINALGYYFGVVHFPLCYFPIDEAHPTFTSDPYSFSKQIMEETAAYFWRREGISGICMRLPAVYEIVEGQESVLKDFVARSLAAYQEITALPQAEQRARVRHLIARIERMRVERAYEQPIADFGIHLPDAPLTFGRNNFWTSIDSRDSAQAIEKALLAEYEGSHPVYVNDGHNFMGLETESLARTFFPEVEARARPLQGDETLVSIDKVRALIAFEPQYTVSEWFDR
jgi:nucleoside-diphosphate-sugar epimerase